MPADFYDLLDVGSEASPEAIRRAYREKAREYHPDVNPDARSSDQFKAIRAAYEVLSDASERKDYDRMGHRTYVDARLDGLPGAKNTGSSGKSSSSSSSATGGRTTNRRSRQSGTGRRSTTTGGSGGRARSTTQGSGGSSKNRSDWGERTISEPGARARAMRAGDRIGIEPFLALAAVSYLAGLGLLLSSGTSEFEVVVEPLLGGNVDSFLSILQTPGFADPMAVVGPAIDSPSPALLFPVGAVGFPILLAVQAIQTSRSTWWLSAVLALGPLVGLGLAAGAFVVTVAVDLSLYVVLPALAVVGAATTWLRN